MRETRTLSQLLTPASVDATNRHADTERFRDALAMLPSLSARHADASDVASLASVLLGDYFDAGHEASDAARMAVSRAAKWQVMLQTDRTDVPAMPVGDTYGQEAYDRPASESFARPDAITLSGQATLLGTLSACLPGKAEREVFQALTLTDDDDSTCWQGEGTGTPNGAALARVLSGRTSKRAGNEARNLATDVLHTCRQDAPRVLTFLSTGRVRRHTWDDTATALSEAQTETYALSAAQADRSRADRVTGTASPVVVSLMADHYGYAWHLGYGCDDCARLQRRGIANGCGTYGDTCKIGPRPYAYVIDPAGTLHTASNADDLEAFLGWTDALPALAAGTVREVRKAQSEPMAQESHTANVHRTETRANGVGIGVRHGHGGPAPDMPPAPRPQGSRKRKRDGGIGGPMVPAAR